LQVSERTLTILVCDTNRFRDGDKNVDKDKNVDRDKEIFHDDMSISLMELPQHDGVY